MPGIGIGISPMFRRGIAAPSLLSAVIADAAPSNIVLTFSAALDETSTPATTAFTIAGKTVSAVVVAGSTVTVTVAVAFAYGDVVTITYVQPVVNPITTPLGGKAASLTNHLVTNNISSGLEFSILCPDVTLKLTNVVTQTFESGNIGDSYIDAGEILAFVADERTGGSGSRSLSITRPVGGLENNSIYGLMPPVSLNDWLRLSYWTKNIDCSGGVKPYIANTIDLASVEPSTAWKNKILIDRKTDAGNSYLRVARVGDTDGQSARVDDIIVDKITFSSMLSFIGTATSQEGVWYCNPTVADQSISGMLINYADADNFVMAIVYRRETVAGTSLWVRLYKRIAGTYTLLLHEPIEYVDGAELRVVVSGTSYMVLYDGRSSQAAYITIADAVLGYDVYGFNTLEENTVGIVAFINRTLTTFPALSNSSITVTPVVPVNFIDGVLYGNHAVNVNHLYSSVDNGTNWTKVQETGLAAGFTQMFKLPDGEVIASASAGGVYKSSGWSTPSTATWDQKQAISAGAWMIFNQLDVWGSKVIMTEYAASPRDASRYVWLSTDSGETFNMVLDIEEVYPAVPIGDIHWHSVCIDHKTGRLFASNGDGVASRGIFYSDNNGVSWTKISTRQPTTLKSARHGVVCGSDDWPRAPYGISEDASKVNSLVVDEFSTAWGYSEQAARDDTTGIVYVSYNTDNPATVLAPIFASDGWSANKVYGLPAITGAVIRLLMVYNGKLVAYAPSGGTHYLIVADL